MQVLPNKNKAIFFVTYGYLVSLQKIALTYTAYGN